MDPLEILGIVSSAVIVIFGILRGTYMRVRQYETLIREARTNGEAIRYLAKRVTELEGNIVKGIVQHFNGGRNK